MAQTPTGKAITERYYRRNRRLMLSLAYLIKAIWKAFGIDGGGAKPGLVTRMMAELFELIEHFRQLSLALAHEYFVSYISIEHPTWTLTPARDKDGNLVRAEWATMDVHLSKDLDDLTDTMLGTRVAEIPGATEAIVDQRTYADIHDTDTFPRIAKVMGDDFADNLTSPTDKEHTTDNTTGHTPGHNQPPIALAPDPHPLNKNNVTTRLTIKGPDNLTKQANKIHTQNLDDDEKARRVQVKSDASWVRMVNAAGSLADGGTGLIEQMAADQNMGVVRVLGPNPCAFCVALAALGTVYPKGVWGKSDARFAGGGLSGNAKVHDGCQCRLEPVPFGTPDDALPPGVQRARELWDRAVSMMPEGYSWKEQYNNFRHLFRNGEFVERDWEFERPMAISRREELRLRIPSLMMRIAWKKYLLDEGIEWKKSYPRAKIEDEARFAQHQLEYALQQWEKYGFGETDWVREYEWFVERSASTVPTEEERKREGVSFRRDIPGRDWWILEKSNLQRDWLLEQYPDAREHKDKFWRSDSPVPVSMPEFD